MEERKLNDNEAESPPASSLLTENQHVDFSKGKNLSTSILAASVPYTLMVEDHYWWSMKTAVILVLVSSLVFAILGFLIEHDGKGKVSAKTLNFCSSINTLVLLGALVVCPLMSSYNGVHAENTIISGLKSTYGISMADDLSNIWNEETRDVKWVTLRDSGSHEGTIVTQGKIVWLYEKNGNKLDLITDSSHASIDANKENEASSSNDRAGLLARLLLFAGFFILSRILLYVPLKVASGKMSLYPYRSESDGFLAFMSTRMAVFLLMFEFCGVILPDYNTSSIDNEYGIIAINYNDRAGNGDLSWIDGDGNLQRGTYMKTAEGSVFLYGKDGKPIERAAHDGNTDIYAKK